MTVSSSMFWECEPFIPVLTWGFLSQSLHMKESWTWKSDQSLKMALPLELIILMFPVPGSSQKTGNKFHSCRVAMRMQWEHTQTCLSTGLGAARRCFKMRSLFPPLFPEWLQMDSHAREKNWKERRARTKNDNQGSNPYHVRQIVRTASCILSPSSTSITLWVPFLWPLFFAWWGLLEPTIWIKQWEGSCSVSDAWIPSSVWTPHPLSLPSFLPGLGKRQTTETHIPIYFSPSF